MKPFQLLRNSPFPRSALHQAFNPSRTLPNHLPNHTPTIRRPLSNLLARPRPRKPFTLPLRRPYSTPPQNPYNPTSSLNSPTASLSLSQRLRKLSREYGWSAFGVYMLITALDFPFCFAAVRYLGTDRIGRWEHVIVGWVKSAVPEGVREAWRKRMSREGERGAVAVAGVEGDAGYDHGVEEAEKMNKSDNASIWTQLALAYAIHKSFIFIRVPLTVAVTPKVVKVLRGWGWDIGKRRPKGAK